MPSCLGQPHMSSIFEHFNFIVKWILLVCFGIYNLFRLNFSYVVFPFDSPHTQWVSVAWMRTKPHALDLGEAKQGGKWMPVFQLLAVFLLILCLIPPILLLVYPENWFSVLFNQSCPSQPMIFIHLLNLLTYRKFMAKCFNTMPNWPLPPLMRYHGGDRKVHLKSDKVNKNAR